MPLVFAFAALASGALLLAMGLTGASAQEVFAGQAHLSSPGSSGSSSSASSAATSAVTGGATAGSVSGQVGEVTPAMLAAIGKSYGWTGAQLEAWMGVIKKESGGNPTAQNPTSDAYGIAQGIDGPAWYKAHGGSVSTVTGQLTAMANYIKSRYGDPSVALAHENSNDWY